MVWELLTNKCKQPSQQILLVPINQICEGRILNMDQKCREEIFSSWISSHEKLIHKIVFGFARTAEDQEDLFQEISLCLWNSIPKYSGNCSESTWIYRIARNVCINSYRWNKRQIDALTLDRDLPDNRDKEVLEDETLWLRTKVHCMNLVDRSLLQLCLRGHSNKEIANTLEISESYVRVKKHRITASLSEAWESAC